jgi:hypothetical protein
MKLGRETHWWIALRVPRVQGMKGMSLGCKQRWLFVALFLGLLLISAAPGRAQTGNYHFNDSQFHLTNNIQEGPDVRDFWI